MARKQITVDVRLITWTGDRDGRTRGVTLRVVDKTNGIEFLDVDLTDADVAGLLGGWGTDATAEVRGLDKLGLKRTVKSVHVPVRDGDPVGSEPPQWVQDHPAPEEGFRYAHAHRNNARQWVIIFDRYSEPAE